jgi:hypothetical protein
LAALNAPQLTQSVAQRSFPGVTAITISKIRMNNSTILAVILGRQLERQFCGSSLEA